MLLLISTADNDWYISTCGYGITAFTDAGIQYIGKQMKPDLSAGDFMRRVAVDMQNALFADAIATALQKFDSSFEAYQSENPAKTTDMCTFTEANVLIMEVMAYMPWKLEERMKIRGEVKAQNPDCKIVLVVEETVMDYMDCPFP